MNFGARFFIFFVLSTVAIIADLILYIYSDLDTVAFIVILVAAIFIGVIPVFGGKSTNVELTGTSLRIRAPFVDLDIPYSRIDAMDFRTSYNPGIRTYGYGGLKKGYGDFTNKEFGFHTFSGDASVNAFILIRHSGKNILVFNTGDENTTSRIYEQLKSLTKAESLHVSKEVSDANAQAMKKSIRNVIIVSVVAVVAIVALILGLMFLAGHTDASLDDDSLTVKAFMVNKDIAYTDITLVELREDVQYGSRVGGYGGSDYLSGRVLNDEFGKYWLAVKKSTTNCIVVHSTYDTLVFNLDSNEATAAFYADLNSRL